MIWPDALATLVGAVVAFAFGAGWYGLLARPWMRAARVTAEEATMSAGLLVGVFALLVLVSGGVGWLLATVGIERSIPSAVVVTAIAWLTLLAAPIAVNHRYQRAGWSLTAIDAAHWLVVFEIAALAHVIMNGRPKLGLF